SVETFIKSQMMIAFTRRPASLPSRGIFRSAMELHEHISTTRYLVPLKRKHVLCGNYRDNVLSGKDEGFFYDAFRMNRDQFDFIVDLIKDHSVFARRGKKPQRPVAIQLKVALHRLAHDGSLSSLAAVGR
ncbi:hypothetical protein BGX23_003597, partial [Mortierella sp. AD031]